MNKYIVLLFAAGVVLINNVTLAQESPPISHRWMVGFKGLGSIPTGNFKQGSDFGYGGKVWVGFDLDPTISLSANVGYNHFTGKDYALIVDDIKVDASTSYNVTPFTLALRICNTDGDSRIYGMAEAGVYVVSVSVDARASGYGSYVSASTSESRTKFGISPVLGAQFKTGDKMSVDTHVGYTAVFVEGETWSWLGFGIGLEFSMR
jgi:opacity protein-like surface antigen